MKLTEADIGKWAVWSYPYYPFYLCGEINDLSGDRYPVDHVQTVQFGRGHWFKPTLIVAADEGRRLQALQRELANKAGEVHREADRLLFDLAKARAPDVLKALKAHGALGE